ncbi:hypothetical protein FRC08_015559 [Ceratobasidium sp. 394]|nr:hypothetical protein FRC08_015559 [Ceratobasidium sp. 394]
MPPRRTTRQKSTRPSRLPAPKVSGASDDSSSGNAGTSSGSGGVSGDSSPASDTTKFNPGLKHPVPKPSNAGELSLFELLHKAKLSGIFDNNAPLTAQMNAVVAEIDQFFVALKESYPWVEKDLNTFMGLKNGKVTLGCGIEHAGQAFEITLKMATFQNGLSIKYPWVRRTLEKLRNIGSLNDPIDDVLDSALASMYNFKEPKKSNIGVSTDEPAGVERIRQLTTVYLHPNFIINKGHWMYIMAGVCPNTANHWTISDIIFSPIVPFAFPGQLSDDFSTVLSTPFRYWVCTPDKQHPVLNTWAPSELGSCHPLSKEFVLQHFYSQVLFWVYCGTGTGSSGGELGERPGEPKEQASEQLNGDGPVDTRAGVQGGDQGIPGSLAGSPAPVAE